MNGHRQRGSDSGHMSRKHFVASETGRPEAAPVIGGRVIPSCVVHSSTFLRPFAPPELPGFVATMDSLTPERPVLRAHRRTVNAVLNRPGLLASWIKPSDHSVSNHPPSPLEPGLVSVQSLPRESTLWWVAPRRAQASWASPIGSRLAATTGRIEFVILRTGRSPRVAPHPASRRRSYVRLQSQTTIDEDLHLADSIHLQAHCHACASQACSRSVSMAPGARREKLINVRSFSS